MAARAERLVILRGVVVVVPVEVVDIKLTGMLRDERTALAPVLPKPQVRAVLPEPSSPVLLVNALVALARLTCAANTS
jgi:hypothetical protein